MSEDLHRYVCQQCKQPLRIDPELVDLPPSAYGIIEGSVSQPNSPASRNVAGPKSAKSAKSATMSKAQAKQPVDSSGPGESFVLLRDSVIHSTPKQRSSPQQSPRRLPNEGKTTSSPRSPPAPLPETQSKVSLSHQIRSHTQLFNFLSSRTEIDHPLCAECTHVLLTSLTRQLEEMKKERDGYLAFEKEIRKEKERESDADNAKIDSRIRELKSQEQGLVKELKQLDSDRLSLEKELQALELEEKLLEEEEDQFWQRHNNHLLKSTAQAAEIESLRRAYAVDSMTLEKLERTNVYNDAFCIGLDGVFGTINGLRLGRAGNVTVEWAEINAAWGQTLLLLYTIARKLDYEFENYRLVPLGSFSRIERIAGDKAIYELYGSGDLHIGRILHNRRFDYAMIAFLECLREIMDYVKSMDAQVEFRHTIIKDRIGDASIKLQFAQDEAWTRALRHVLLALKIVLKWVTNAG